MRVGLYQKFFTWAMLNLTSCSASSQPCLSAEMLLFNNNLYSPMLFSGSIIASIPA